MEDILKSIKAFLYERSVSPLLEAYAVAWSICNYQFWIIFFSGERYSEKFGAINKYFENHSIGFVSGEWLIGFGYPILITIAYLYLYPFLAEPVYKHSLNKQRKLRDIKQAAEEEKLLSVAESRELYRQLANLQGEYDEKVEFYTKQISSLNKLLSELEKNRDDSHPDSPYGYADSDDDPEHEPLESILSGDGEINDNEMEIPSSYTDFGDYIVFDKNDSEKINKLMFRIIIYLGINGSENISRVVSELSESDANIRYCANKLKRMRLIKYSRTGILSLTEEGNELFVKNNLDTQQ